ncbi:MAG TPA: gamma-glutamyltransferase family protein [Burkholderiales bacterium]|jgi:gamma-glutamyltranspeptidase/glutathione hydrolase
MQFNWNFPYATKRIPVYARNVVATSHPLAVQAGVQAMANGGNAVDAALAAAITLTIVEPISNGLGSDAFCILWDGKKLHGLNASGRSPKAWSVDYFKKLGNRPERGINAISVPGAVSAWVALSEKFGKLPFEDLFQSAIRYATEGYLVTPIVQQKWKAMEPILKGQPGFAEHFLPKGRTPHVGENFILRGAAETLKKIAATKGEAFYKGEIAERIAAHSKANGGVMTFDDLASHTCDWVEPIELNYRGYTVHEIPPNGQGIAALMALGMVENYDLASMDPDGPEAQHILIEAMKLAFADIGAYVSDPRTMKISPEQLLDRGYLKERAKLIDPKKATRFSAGTPPKGGTIYLTAADKDGMMVSFIQSNYMGFGSGAVTDGGISLQNRGYGFVMTEGHPNVVEGGKRPFHTIIPGFLTKNGAPQMSFGVMGGNMQPQGHLQTLVRMLDYKMNPQAACDAPRWRVAGPMAINGEVTMKPELIAALKGKGHEITAFEDSYMDYGSGQFIWRCEEDNKFTGYIAASDARKDGQAAGF